MNIVEQKYLWVCKWKKKRSCGKFINVTSSKTRSKASIVTAICTLCTENTEQWIQRCKQCKNFSHTFGIDSMTIF